MTATTPNRSPPGSYMTPPSIEQQVARLDEQMRTLKAQVRQAQQLASLGTATAMISHEMSNLLTPILPYAEAALESNDLDLKDKALRTVVKNIRMLVAMSDRLLELGAAKPRSCEAVSIHDAAEEALASLCRDPSKDGIRKKFEIDDGLRATVDPLHLRQVLFNLFLNANEAMKPARSGCLSVVAKRSGEQVVIEVRDTGEGIPPERLSAIFDPCESSKPVERNGRWRCGGLGLALCRDLIDENGGTISVASEMGGGTVFTITLPAAPD